MTESEAMKAGRRRGAELRAESPDWPPPELREQLAALLPPPPAAPKRRRAS